MERLIQAVEQLRNLSDSDIDVDIDVNFRQDKVAFRAQLYQSLKYIHPIRLITDKDIEQGALYTQEAIEELRVKIAPYTLPEDYIFFIEYYGGIAADNTSFRTVANTSFRFEIYGYGPMVNELYSDWVFDNWGERQDPLLPGPRGFIIGYLRFDTILGENKKRNAEAKEQGVYDAIADVFRYPEIVSEWIELRLDLAGKVHPHCIIALGPNKGNTVHPLSIGSEDFREWRVLARSFTELIELASQTRCQLGYAPGNNT
jgi:hypothetical protein